jgi:hypothetical protein
MALTMAAMPIGDEYLPKSKLAKEQPLFPVEMFLCEQCGHAQLLDVIDPGSIYSEYIYRTSDSLGLVRHFGDAVETLLGRYSPKPGSLVVDIGSNDGSFLRTFQKSNMKVIGIEPATRIAKGAQGAGVETVNEFFSSSLARKLRHLKGPAKIMTCNNAFANIDDLEDLVEGVRHWLCDDGIFVLETGYLVDLLEKTIFDNIYHEHISYFSVKPLERFFSRHGLDLVDVERIDTKGGSIRCVAQHAKGPRSRSSRVPELMALEKELGVQQPQIFYDFAERLAGLKMNIEGLLTESMGRSVRVAGYGASVGVTTALYNLGLGKKQLEFLADDNPDRQGLFSPGLKIPIVNPKELYLQDIDVVLVLAWQYFDPIVSKHQAFFKKGGRFIKILPGLCLVDSTQGVS